MLSKVKKIAKICKRQKSCISLQRKPTEKILLKYKQLKPETK